MSHVLVIGEALVDVIRPQSRHRATPCRGSPANVAYGLGRLGRPARLLTRLGDDQTATCCAAHLASVGRADSTPVRSHWTVRRRQSPRSARRLGDLHLRPGVGARLTTLALGEPLAVHTGSIGALLAPGAATVERLVEAARSRSTISYDPNIRPMLVGSVDETRPRVEHFIAASDVVKASQEDIEWLYPGVEPTTVSRRWLELGPAIVVVTMGRSGSVAVARNASIDVPAPRVAVVDTVGAGDSFMAGLLDGLWREGLLGAAARDDLSRIDAVQLRRVVEHATRAAAITVSRAGALPPTRSELAEVQI